MTSSKEILTAALWDTKLESNDRDALGILHRAVIDVLAQIDGELDAVREDGYSDGREDGWYDGRADCRDEHDEGV